MKEIYVVACTYEGTDLTAEVYVNAQSALEAISWRAEENEYPHIPEMGKDPMEYYQEYLTWTEMNPLPDSNYYFLIQKESV